MKRSNYIQTLICLLFMQFIAIGAFAQQATIKEAEEAYQKEDYGKAIELYEKLIQTEGESAAIYYNLGNAYYKENKIAPAILNYERALLLDTAALAIRFHWQMARQNAGAKMKPVGPFVWTAGFGSIQ